MAGSPGGVEVGRVSVRVVPDTSRLFEDLKADLDRIERESSIDIKASVDSARLVESARAAVSEAQALAGDIDIKANVDTSQVAQAESVLRGAAGAAGGLISNFSVLGAGAGILATALIPLVAVLGGIAAALAAPLAVVAGGVTIFGFIAGFAAHGTLEQIKAIDKAAQHLGTLKKGTAAYAAAAADLKAKQDALTPAQKAFASALSGLKSAIADPRLSNAALKPLTDAMKLLAKILPDLTPIIGAVGGVFDDIVKQMGQVVSSPGFKGFVKAFAHDLGRDLKAFSKIAGNIFIGLGGLFGALDDTLSKGVLKGLENITGKFADFGRNAKDNKGLKAFVAYVKQNMPKVGQLIGNVFGLIGDIFGTLAPLGSGVLDVLNGLTGALRGLDGVAGPLSATLAGLGLGTLLGGPEVGLAVAGVIGLVGAFKQLYDRSKPLRDVIHDIGDYFTKTWLPLIQEAATQIVPALKGAISDVSDTIRNNKGLFKTLGDALVALGSATIIGAIEQTALSIRLIGKAFKFGTAAVKLWANVTLTIFRLIVDGVKLMVEAVLAQFGTIVNGAAAAFGWMPKIGPKVKAARDAFNDFSSNVVGNIDAVGDGLKQLQTQINEVGQSHPKFHIDSNTLTEIAHMHELQRLQIADKRFKITATIEQQIDRVTGPGGGIQRPSSLSSGSGGGGGTTINVNKVEAHDYKDFLRQLANQRRAHSGGGVPLPAGG